MDDLDEEIKSLKGKKKGHEKKDEEDHESQ